MSMRCHRKYGLFSHSVISVASCLRALIACILLWNAQPIHAEDVWYQPYEDGIKDLESGKLVNAEGKFLRAIQLKPDPEKNAKKYGQRFIEYVPQYYLALIYYKQGKDQQAEQQLAVLSASGVLSKTEIEQRLKRDGVDTARSKQSEMLVQEIQDLLNRGSLSEAANALEKLRATSPNDPSIPKIQTVLNAKREADALVRQARQLLDGRRFAEADTALKRAKSQDPSHPEIPKLSDELAAKQDAEKLIARADDLRGRRQFDGALDSLQAAEGKDPGNQRIADLRKQILQEQKNLVAQSKKAEDIESLIRQADAAVASDRFSEARSFLAQAQATGANAPKLAELRKSIDIAESGYLLRAGENAIRKQDFPAARQAARRVEQIGIRKREAVDLIRKADTAEAKKLVQDGNRALQSGNLMKAQDFASRALQMEQDHPQAKELVQRIRIRQELDAALFSASKKDWKNARFHALEVQKLDPANPELAKLMAALQKKEAPPPPPPDPLAQQRDAALLAYFTGDYEQAAKILSDVNDKVGSTQTLFYLACSNAALGLMRGPNGKELLARATRQFAMVKQMEPGFVADPSLISPRIIRIYQQAH